MTILRAVAAAAGALTLSPDRSGTYALSVTLPECRRRRHLGAADIDGAAARAAGPLRSPSTRPRWWRARTCSCPGPPTAPAPAVRAAACPGPCGAAARAPSGRRRGSDSEIAQVGQFTYGAHLPEHRSRLASRYPSTSTWTCWRSGHAHRECHGDHGRGFLHAHLDLNGGEQLHPASGGGANGAPWSGTLPPPAASPRPPRRTGASPMNSPAASTM